MSQFKLFGEVLGQVPDHLAAPYRDQAALYWDKFYRRNKDRFFKDRHWLDKVWPQLLEPHVRIVLEVGCGAGNTVFPLLELNPLITVYACDFSATAVEMVADAAAATAPALRARLRPFVADIAAPGALAAHVPPGSVDCCTMVFVLSALAPERMAQALAHVAACLRPGSGRLLFRDYAAGDMAQARLESKGSAHKRLGRGFYVRGDGTCCYYFQQGELVTLAAAAGLECEEAVMQDRLVENRASGQRMERRFVHAVFVRSHAAAAPAPVVVAGAPPAAARGHAAEAPGDERGSAADDACAWRCAGGAACMGGSADAACTTNGRWQSWSAGSTTWELPPRCGPPPLAAARVLQLLLEQQQLVQGRCVLLCVHEHSALAGAGGALAALLAARLGARRAVLALLTAPSGCGCPGSLASASQQQPASSQQQRRLEELGATLRGNAARVVWERVRCVRASLSAGACSDGSEPDPDATHTAHTLQSQALRRGYGSLLVALPPPSTCDCAACEPVQQLFGLCRHVGAGSGMAHDAVVVGCADATGNAASSAARAAAAGAWRVLATNVHVV